MSVVKSVFVPIYAGAQTGCRDIQHIAECLAGLCMSTHVHVVAIAIPLILANAAGKTMLI